MIVLIYLQYFRLQTHQVNYKAKDYEFATYLHKLIKNEATQISEIMAFQNMLNESKKTEYLPSDHLF